MKAAGARRPLKAPRAPAQQLTFDQAAAEQAKADGLALIEARHEDVVGALRAFARAHALQHGRVHIDDVRRFAQEANLAVHKNAWGAIFRPPEWRKVGERASTIVTNHRHRSPEWALR
jgi:hypothetical protein